MNTDANNKSAISANNFEEKLHHDKGAAPESGRLGKVIQSLGIIFAVAILLSALILVIEVFLRYVFNRPTIWAHESVIFLNACAFVFGGLYAAARNEHIRVVLLYDFVKKSSKRVLNIIISIICMLASIIFAWAAWMMVQKAIYRPGSPQIHLETSGTAWNQPTPALLKIFLLIVLAVMALQFLIFTISYFKSKGDN